MLFKKIAFRVDSSTQIGSGHVVRCLNLADSLKKMGGHCHFFCRNIEGNLISLIRKRGFKVSVFDFEASARYKTFHNFTLEDWEFDVRKTLASIDADHFDWMIVDHYELDSKWEGALRKKCDHLMAIDDIANRPHNCDILVDQNYEDFSRYNNLVPKRCVLLLGPKYALLRHEYAQYRKFRIEEKRDSLVNKVLVYFGGSDPQDLTGKALEALSLPNLNSLNLDIVLGGNYAYFERLEKFARRRGRTQIFMALDHLADLMVKADIAIGGGGVTNWERICIGLPSIVITMADNQVPISKILDQNGVIRLIGSSEVVGVKDIYNAFLEEIDSSFISSRALVAMNLCDGMGLDRVLNEMKSIQ